MARVVNNYKPTIRLHDGDLWGPHPDYDVNWAFPLQLLENAVVQLTPFIPRLHAETFWQQFQPESAPLTRYFPLTLLDLEAFLTFVEFEFRRKYDGVLFAIVDKTQPHDSGLSGALAGVIGLLRTVPTQLTTEIGGVITLPRFQRTHVTSNAIGLLLQ
jgi:RimJ/RimL family protein N-acetyltransferase